MKLPSPILFISLMLQAGITYSGPQEVTSFVMDSLIQQHESVLYEDPDAALLIANQCIELALSAEDEEQLLNAYTLVASNFAALNYYQSAIEYYRKAANIAIQLKRWGNAGSLFSGISLVNDAWGKYPEALQASQKAAHYFQKAGDQSGKARSYNDIGIIHYYREDYQLAEEYLLKAKNICLEIGDSVGMALFFVNMGNIYADTEQYEKAFQLYQKAFDLDSRSGDWEGQSICLSNMGETLTAMGKYFKAEKTLLQSLKIAEAHQDAWAMTNPLRALGELYRSTNESDKAIETINRSLQLAKSIDATAETAEAYALLTELYKEKGDHLTALKNYELYNATKDSLFNQENSRLINEMEAKYQVEDKEKKIKLLEQQSQIDQLKHQEEIVKEKDRRILLLSVLGFMLLVSGFILYSFLSKKKANKELELQKLKVENKNEQLQVAFGQIEEKNREIIGSIQYAKRIQTAILPPLRVVNQYLPESFILYKPKDIVAGDFYWLEAPSNSPKGREQTPLPSEGVGGRVFFAAADCTGHGVPGAMVSVMCSNALTRAVKELGITEPAKILDKASLLLEERFERSEEEMKDGMDIALCSLEYKKSLHYADKLHYAGANNPLYHIRAGQLTEAKADKQPIGKHEDRKPFTNHSIELQKGDTIYIFSDGYVDQFGGPKGKKFKSRAFKEMLLSVQDKSMQEQKQIIDETFENWKAWPTPEGGVRELEQIDDVCIIGVKV